MKAIRQNISPSLRNAVIEGKGRHCGYCGKGPLYKKALQLDHIVPVVSGGTNSYENLIPCCTKCNKAKQSKPLRVYIARRIPALERELQILKALQGIYGK